jgi:hypothetical protein
MRETIADLGRRMCRGDLSFGGGIGHRRKLVAPIAALRGDASQAAADTEPAAVAISGAAELTVMFCDAQSRSINRFVVDDLSTILSNDKILAAVVGNLQELVTHRLRLEPTC